VVDLIYAVSLPVFTNSRPRLKRLYVIDWRAVGSDPQLIPRVWVNPKGVASKTRVLDIIAQHRMHNEIDLPIRANIVLTFDSRGDYLIYAKRRPTV
jgi:hypothetical protein